MREFAIQGEGELHKSPLIIKMINRNEDNSRRITHSPTAKQIELQKPTSFYKRIRCSAFKKLCEAEGRTSERRIIKPMETKSRYEVVLELEEKKRNLVMERDCLGDEVRYREKQIRDLKREIEDKEDDLKDYKENLEEKKNTIKELIEATEDSLNRLAGLNKSK